MFVSVLKCTYVSSVLAKKIFFWFNEVDWPNENDLNSLAFNKVTN